MNSMGDEAAFEPLSERELEVLHLLAEGMSNREIAQALFLAPETVKWYTKQIYSKLGVHSRTQAVARGRDLALLNAPDGEPDEEVLTPHHNLPAQLTSFVGREREIAEVQQLLATHRLVTLSGPPGTGKTRLALEVARRVLYGFEDGVTFVDLVSVAEPQRFLPALAQALGILEMGSQPLLETLKRALGDKHMLLLLDNFEQIVSAAPLVGELLAAAPRLSVLVTSREVLQIYGETEVPVLPLALPDREHLTDVHGHPLAQVEAVQLFVQRAQAVRPGFEITEDNADAIAELCIRLDGLPLAIELAAARVRVLSVRELTARLVHRFALLTSVTRNLPPRHRTLHATIDWSYDLLGPEERALFARLSVFRGGFTAESAAAVCGQGREGDVLGKLESLLTKSLLVQEDGLDGVPRFAMLESLRMYAGERLEESGDAETYRRRHAATFAALAAEADPRLRGGPDQATWFARLRAERSNLQQALAWSLGGADIELGVRLAGALCNFWYDEGQIGEGIRWTSLALTRSAGAPPALRGKLLGAAGELCFAQGAYERGRELTQQALHIHRALGDTVSTAWSMVVLGAHTTAFPGEFQKGLALCEEGLALFKHAAYRPGMARALVVRGELARMNGADALAQQAYEEALSLYEAIGDRRRVGMVLSNMGHVALKQGNPERARELFTRAIEQMDQGGSDYFLVFGLAGLAGPLAAQGDAERAARLLGAAESVLENLGVDYQPPDRPAIEETIARVRGQLPDGAFQKAWAQGRGLSLREAVAYALEKRSGQAPG